jgi:hypothetical protein
MTINYMKPHETDTVEKDNRRPQIIQRSITALINNDQHSVGRDAAACSSPAGLPQNFSLGDTSLHYPSSLPSPSPTLTSFPLIFLSFPFPSFHSF